ncbi:transporter [Sphingopyxis sp. H038]|uniref:TadE/TadG family type IV pilus assembly protein n=1 Tax=unclassified Sphingopyxis TaxID=2614943 RepID=UPI000731A1A7|nr:MULTISPECIES: TadE/TadG family type IV pilus assembly protein [unclassified Sphingopyxis]KTE29954.1 transporter [Sphingopyxis sp. H080]KTE39613.1 transporter [Sphingopyxis sp. H077]KTE43341.1 transporter [Sphingopyxis sp. H005]KTE02103.1 transporter [Sphingopyxis sp. H012]KTE09851.1 transporter [Sphingopyxis sp. H053]
MTGSIRLSRRVRKIALTGLTLARGERGAAIVEMALVLPLLLALLMGILVYGQYFMLAHSVQQAANDGARASIVGLDAADRSAVASRAVGRSLQAVGGTHSVAVSETTEAITVAVTFTVPQDSLLRSSFVPSPGNVIRARATFELPVD